MRPEVVGEVGGDGVGEVEVLELREGLEGGHGDNVDAEYLRESVVVHVERVLGGQQAPFIGVKGSGVFDDVDVLWWPSLGYICYDDLLQKRPVACKSYVEAGGFWDVRVWRRVPARNWREVGRRFCLGGEGEVLGERRRIGPGIGFVERVWL